MSLIPGLGGSPLDFLGGLSSMNLLEKPLELFGKDLFSGNGLGGILGLAGQFLESPLGEMAASAFLGPAGPLAAKVGGSLLEKEGSSLAQQQA